MSTDVIADPVALMKAAPIVGVSVSSPRAPRARSVESTEP
jgi:hypothetical protein